ncbi:MAG TPA: HlyD family efflux transporter periplasmic adaptor subunit [Candidatus Galloscillospira excrementavium]|nr:HlyD family efflux transporter periplasmic adaptor subunit [Candidatus Galloscillospira excrementavium]
MAEQTTPVMTPPSHAAPEKKKKNKKIVKNVLLVLVILAAVAAAAWAIWYFVFTEHKGAAGEPIYDTAQIGSIVSTVRGGGSANAKDSASISLAADGVVQEVYVTQGQVVNAGDPLYVVTSPAAEEALKAAQEALVTQQENLAKLQEEMNALQQSRNDLTIRAPHDGKLTEVAEVNLGDPLTSGFTIAKVVDDTRLKISLYYSYAYENDIHVGQTASVSIPATMTTLTGTVEKINKVERITVEGGRTFEVVFVIDNPGTLTEGMAATAQLTDGSGNPIYPYESGTLSYYQTTTVATKANGPVEQLADLMNYANVTAGQVLLVQGTNDVDEQIRAKQEQLDAAVQAVADAEAKVAQEQQNVQNFSAVAPISGTVVTCTLYPGQEVTAGTAAVVIADNTVMTVNIQVDDRNRQYISEGMEITLNDWNGNTYLGVVESVAVVGEVQNGVTVFPAVVRVDNPTGTLMGGYYLDYEFATAQSLDCVVVPIQDVRSYTPEGAEQPQSVVYLKLQPGESAPDNAIDKSLLPEQMQEEIPDECVVIPVETGLNDDINVEIKSGLEVGQEVYNNTTSTDGSYYG